jgi:hypothetical protein
MTKDGDRIHQLGTEVPAAATYANTWVGLNGAGDGMFANFAGEANKARDAVNSTFTTIANLVTGTGTELDNVSTFFQKSEQNRIDALNALCKKMEG